MGTVSHGCGEVPGGLAVTDATGAPVVVHGQQPDGSFGSAAYDTSGNMRAQIGQLPGGHVGVRVAGPACNERAKR
jgi:hypothetical protein